jgi:hypothetical protein
MTDTQVAAAVGSALPVWAQALTTITVTDDAVGERIVGASLSVPMSAFVAHNVRDVPDTLAAEQGSLAPNGANIGRTMTTITDSGNGDPLYVAGDDRLWGYSSEWISPLVAGLPGFAESGTPVPPSTPPSNIGSTSIPGSPGPLSPWTPPLSSPPPAPR